jgi:hypothetical protein
MRRRALSELKTAKAPADLPLFAVEIAQNSRGVAALHRHPAKAGIQGRQGCGGCAASSGDNSFILKARLDFHVSGLSCLR